MNKRSGVVGTGVALLACGLTGVQRCAAVWVENQLTPQALVQQQGQHLQFVIHTESRGDLKAYEVTVTAKPGDTLSPVLSGTLTIKDGDALLATVPVAATREGDKVTYWFHITPQFVATSRFEFGEHGYGKDKDQKGHVSYIGLPGGTGHWFKLSDFPGPKD